MKTRSSILSVVLLSLPTLAFAQRTDLFAVEPI
jgi:hypothetical protein